MTYDLFNKLLFIRSSHTNEADFLKELKLMTQKDVDQSYEMIVRKKLPQVHTKL